MSRLEKTAPAANLSDDQKARLATVDRDIEAKIAEKRIFLEAQLAKASFQEQDDIRRQLAAELSRLEDKREREKNIIRNESPQSV
jgi:hypothetical protein